jgi:Tfp pilus assembly protein PilF
VQINLGYWSVRAGHLDVAEANYRRSVRLDPWNAAAHRDLARLLELRGAADEARALRERARWLDPSAGAG